MSRFRFKSLLAMLQVVDPGDEQEDINYRKSFHSLNIFASVA